MRALVIFSMIGIVGTSSISLAFAPCCFPWDITFHTDPETEFLVVSGDLWNDSYISEPFGKADYMFRFTDENNEVLFERNVLITEGHPIEEGFKIPPNAVFPFQFVIDDVDPEIISKVTHVSHGGTNNLEYFGWKPADLRLELYGFEPIEQIHQNGQDFTEWKITGTITNTNSEPTENVYVLASIYDEDQNLVGVAGYSDLDVQPLTLDGFGKKDFTLIEQLPSQKIPVNVSLYAESDDSSMVYKFYMPIILKDATDHTKRISKEYKQPIPIIAKITNTSRENIKFDWIIQIKKSPVSASQVDLTNYPESEVIEIHTIPSFIGAQDNDQLEFSWVPPTDGIYFYEEFIWKDSKPESLPFKGSFISDNWIMVDYSNYTLKNQLKSGIPFDKLECINDLIIILKKDGTHACVKPTSIEKLIERNWITAEIIQEIVFKNMSKALGPECSENSMQDIINGIIDDRCKSYLIKLDDEHKKEMISQGYSFDSEERKWVKEGYPDTMMTIVDYYLQIQAPNPTPPPMTKVETSLLKAEIIPNFPQTRQNQFQQIYQEKDSTCITTPSTNQYCYKKPKSHEGQDRDHLSSIIVGDNEINGEIHFDKVGLDGGIFTIKNMSMIDENSALFTFADKDYRIGNKDRITYEITEKFEFDTVVKKFDSFITHCGNVEGSAATIVQYLGVTNIDGIDYFVTWHTVITSEDNFQCKYPELIQHSLKHEFKEM